MTKKILIMIAAVAVAIGLAIGAHYLSLRQHLQAKLDHVKAGMEEWMVEGWDPDEAIIIMQKAGKAIDEGDVTRAEAYMDKAQAVLDTPPAKRHHPRPAPGEEPSNLYGDPKPVTISGYDGNAMEPFISPDGHYLFFNNENDPGAQTDLHVAERTGTSSFRYFGPLKNANSSALDAAASIDKVGHIYFTSSRDYGETLKSIFTGIFEEHEVRNLHVLPGNINPKEHGTINMDVSISPDGNTLYISRATFKQGLTGPEKSDILIAHLHNGVFEMDPQSDAIMKNVNTAQLEYAPAISADGRELFFTRSQAPAEPLAGPQFRIMVATRNSDTAPFGKPKQLVALSGLVEAPSIPLDKHELFFHKKVKDKWIIYRAVRK